MIDFQEINKSLNKIKVKLIQFLSLPYEIFTEIFIFALLFPYFYQLKTLVFLFFDLGGWSELILTFILLSVSLYFIHIKLKPWIQKEKGGRITILLLAIFGYFILFPFVYYLI